MTLNPSSPKKLPYPLSLQLMHRTALDSVKFSQLAEMFNHLDYDGNGTIELDEIRQALQLISYNEQKAEEILEKFVLMDADGSGELDFEEFVMVMSSDQQGRGFFTTLKEEKNQGVANQAFYEFATTYRREMLLEIIEGREGANTLTGGEYAASHAAKAARNEELGISEDNSRQFQQFKELFEIQLFSDKASQKTHLDAKALENTEKKEERMREVNRNNVGAKKLLKRYAKLAKDNREEGNKMFVTVEKQVELRSKMESMRKNRATVQKFSAVHHNLPVMGVMSRKSSNSPNPSRSNSPKVSATRKVRICAPSSGTSPPISPHVSPTSSPGGSSTHKVGFGVLPEARTPEFSPNPPNHRGERKSSPKERAAPHDVRVRMMRMTASPMLKGRSLRHTSSAAHARIKYDKPKAKPLLPVTATVLSHTPRQEKLTQGQLTQLKMQAYEDARAAMTPRDGEEPVVALKKKPVKPGRVGDPLRNRRPMPKNRKIIGTRGRLIG